MNKHTRLGRSALVALMFCLCVVGVCAAGGGSEDQTRAGEIMSRAGVRGGLVVHVGCGDGRLTRALRLSDSYIVQGLDCDREDVAKARRFIQSEDAYGPVSVRQWNGSDLPYADNTVNLVVSERPLDVPEKELMRALTPRGVVCVKKDGGWEKTVKPWPAEIDEWTHWMYGPEGNGVAHDSVVGPPRHIQWFATPRWQRHHNTVPSTSAMVSSNGRLFYIVDEAPASLAGGNVDKWFLAARDAFNGVLLWKRPMPNWGWQEWSATWRNRGNQPLELPKRLVAIDDRVYVTLGFHAPLTALDAATGKTVKTYEGTEGTDEILYCDGTLLLAIQERKGQPGRDKKPVHKRVCGVDADTGEMLWERDGYVGLHAKADSVQPFGRVELTAGDERVFIMDKNAVLCLDMETGEKLWQKERPGVPKKLVAYFNMRAEDACILVYSNDVLLLAQPEMKIPDPHHTIPGTLYAYSARSGDLLWKHPYGGWSHCVYQPDVFVIDDIVWFHKHVPALEGRKDPEIPQGKNVGKHAMFPPRDKMDFELLGLDLRSGEVKSRFSTRKTFNVGHHHRCYRNRATTEFVLASRRGVEFLDVSSGKNWLHHWVRGTCLFGYVPCNGLLYAPPGPCNCYVDTKLNGYYALAAEQQNELKLPVDTWQMPLEKGPAYGHPLDDKTDSAGWPTYRHDARRTSAASMEVKPSVEGAWRTDLGGELSSISVADGRALVACTDRHQVVALDARTGGRIWSFTADARVDAPPTIYRGLALFGARDGWVYCVRAEDGKLVWKRRAAPQERFVGSDGQFESAWPVHGSVLVKAGVAYAAAGRSSYLDRGIFLCAFDPASGKVVKQKNIYSPDPKTDEMPDGGHRDLTGCLADLLATDGGSIYMGEEPVFEGKGGRGTPVHSTAGMLDGAWFNRTYWRVNGMTSHPQLLVCNADYACALQAYSYRGVARGNHFLQPGGKGYKLFRVSIEGGRRGKGWSKHIPVRARAMVLAGDTLFLAGPPDVLPTEDPLAAFEGRRGGKLWAISTKDGKPVRKVDLDSPPVWDGMAAAEGRLYIATKSGSVQCFEPVQ